MATLMVQASCCRLDGYRGAELHGGSGYVRIQNFLSVTGQLADRAGDGAPGYGPIKMLSPGIQQCATGERRFLHDDQFVPQMDKVLAIAAKRLADIATAGGRGTRHCHYLAEWRKAGGARNHRRSDRTRTSVPTCHRERHSGLPSHPRRVRLSSLLCQPAREGSRA
jgi:hypothetical protein